VRSLASLLSFYNPHLSDSVLTLSLLIVPCSGHQTHGDIDAGDFVLDAMGQRWAGELGSGNYLSDGYFFSEVRFSPFSLALFHIVL
jgi:hypothetical protein